MRVGWKNKIYFVLFKNIIDQWFSNGVPGDIPWCALRYPRYIWRYQENDFLVRCLLASCVVRLGFFVGLQKKGPQL